MTLAGDGTILATGGIQAIATASNLMLDHAEIYNPARGDDAACQ